MEDAGHWFPLDQKSDYQIYYKEADWIKKMWDIVDSTLIKSIGIFNAFKNTKGAVRDHKLGRKSGFNLKVFPELLRHPSNCQIISRIDNTKKQFVNCENLRDSTITLAELFQAIIEFNGKWLEQERCLQLINDYKRGMRWKRI